MTLLEKLVEIIASRESGSLEVAWDFAAQHGIPWPFRHHTSAWYKTAPNKDGNGNGIGNGSGIGNGIGSGSGSGIGNGSGSGIGNGSGNGSGSGSGIGNGSG